MTNCIILYLYLTYTLNETISRGTHNDGSTVLALYLESFSFRPSVLCIVYLYLQVILFSIQITLHK